MRKELLGKPIAEKKYAELQERIKLLNNKKTEPKLMLLRFRNDFSYYNSAIIKTANKLNIKTEEIYLPQHKKDIEHTIEILNKDRTIHGILPELPISKELDERWFLSLISPLKDVDCLTPYNLGLLIHGEVNFFPNTPRSIITILDNYNIDTMGMNTVIVGRSLEVGIPLANILVNKKLNRHATVTVCHSKTRNLLSYTTNADILIIAVGKANFFRAHMVKEESIIIDVGTNIVEDNGKKVLVGDVFYQEVKEVVRAITPVPGGVGPVTIAMLLENVVIAAERNVA